MYRSKTLLNACYLFIALCTLYSCQESEPSMQPAGEWEGKKLTLFNNKLDAKVYTQEGMRVCTIELDEQNELPGINVAQAISNEVRRDNFAAVALVPVTQVRSDSFDFANLQGAVQYLLIEDTLRASVWDVYEGKEHADSSLMGPASQVDMETLVQLVRKRFREADQMILLYESDRLQTYPGQTFGFDRQVAGL